MRKPRARVQIVPAKSKGDDDNNSQIYYLCSTAFEHELGETDITPVRRVEDLPSCSKYCGYVELEIKLIKRYPGTKK